MILLSDQILLDRDSAMFLKCVELAFRQMGGGNDGSFCKLRDEITLSARREENDEGKEEDQVSLHKKRLISG